MTKKEFTQEPAKGLSGLSDIELIESMAKATFSDARINTMKGILDYRLKKSINHLKKITERSIVAQDQYSLKLVKLTRVLVNLTWTLVGLTLVVTLATIILLFR